MHATGTFQVNVKPETPAKADLPRFSLDKVWSGEITGTSKGEMLTAGSVENGLRTYVALEHMDVTVDGKKGTFLFRHFASMLPNNAASVQMEVAVVPDSGTGALTGVEGTLRIDIAGGQHTYDFSYTLPGQP